MLNKKTENATGKANIPVRPAPTPVAMQLRSINCLFSNIKIAPSPFTINPYKCNLDIRLHL
jgi:hypothetical protein